MNKVYASIVLAAGALVLAGAALQPTTNRADDGKTIAARLDKDKMTLAKAVAAAEGHSKGRAIAAVPSTESPDNLSIEVYCMNGDKLVRCSVNASTGAVSGMKDAREFPVPPRSADAKAAQFTDQLAEAGCGSCIYTMKGVDGCKLAVKIDGQSYLVTGADHVDAHQFCGAAKKVKVTGKIEGDKFVASKFDVQP